MVFHTFCQPEANEPVDVQRLTSSSAPFFNQRQASLLTRRDKHRLLHLLSSKDGESDDMQRYPSGYPYIRFPLILTREVMWQAEIPKRLSIQTISVNLDL